MEFHEKEGYLLNAGRGIVKKADMEVEAYQKQYSYDRSFPGRANSLNGINLHSVGEIKKEDGTYVYDWINKLASAIEMGLKQGK